MQWYYLLQGQHQGPVDDAGLEALVRQGTVRDETLVWREGLTEWHPYATVKPSSVKAPPAPAPPPRPEPSKTEAASPAPEPSLKREPAPKPEQTGTRSEAASYRPEAVPHWTEPATARMEAPAARSEPLSPRSEPATPRREPGWPEALPFPASPPAPAAAPKTHPGSRHGAFFFYPVLDALADGGVIRKGVVVCLKIAGVVIAVGGVLAAVSVLVNAFHGTEGMVLGGILFALIVLATSACVAQICWHRSGSVAALPPGTTYTVIPIFSILSRASGEAAATGLAGIGLGACLFFWFSPEGAAGALQGVPFMATVPAESGFLTGIIVLVYLAALGVSALILGYLWAECIMLLVDIERNTRKSV